MTVVHLEPAPLSRRRLGRTLADAAKFAGELAILAAVLALPWVF